MKFFEFFKKFLDFNFKRMKKKDEKIVSLKGSSNKIEI